MILDDILDTKRAEVLAAKKSRTESDLRATALYGQARRGFARALSQGPERRIIAEMKKASPSKGLIRENFEPALHAKQYEAAGARCVSVLTDESYFQGALADLEAARSACSLPLLRKDFTIDPYQVVEARSAGADAILLIVAALDPVQLGELALAAADEGLDVLTEVHDEVELNIAMDAGAGLIGVNNRNLKTFETSLNVTRQLAAMVPDEITLVSESGLKHPHELAQLEALGVDAFLIGERLIGEPDPGQAVEFFLGG